MADETKKPDSTVAELNNRLKLLREMSREESDLTKKIELGNKAREVGLQYTTKKLELANKELEIMFKSLSVQENTTEEEKKQYELNKKQYDLKKEEIVQLEKKAKFLSDNEKNLEGVKKSAQGLMAAFGTGKKWTDSALGQFALSMKGNGLSTTVGAFAGEMFNLGNIGGHATATLEKFAEVSIYVINEIDNAAASFAAAAGAIGNYRDVISGAAQASMTFGVSADDAASAAESLLTNFTDFSSMSKINKEELVGFTAELEKLGVSSDVAATTFQTLNKVLGMNKDESVLYMKELRDISAQLGLPASRIATDFQQAAPRLAGYGRDMKRVFGDLERASKATGVSMGSLMGIAEGFDTFEGAASKVGTLNALLKGDYFNTLDMMQMSDSQRIEKIMEVMEAQDMQWDSMNRNQKMAFQAAAGVENLADAAALFQGGAAKFRATTIQQKEEAKLQKEFNEALTDTMSLVSQVAAIGKKAFSAFVRHLEGPLNTLKGWLSDIQIWMDNNQETVHKLGMAIAAFSATVAFLVGVVLMKAFAGLAVAVVGATAPLWGVILPILGIAAALGVLTYMFTGMNPAVEAFDASMSKVASFTKKVGVPASSIPDMKTAAYSNAISPSNRQQSNTYSSNGASPPASSVFNINAVTDSGVIAKATLKVINDKMGPRPA